MTTVLPALPDEVMEALAPAFAYVDQRVRDAVRSTMRKHMNRAGIAAVRALGYHNGHEQGFEHIMRQVFGALDVIVDGEAGRDRNRGIGYRDPDEVPDFVPARPVNGAAVEDAFEDDEDDEDEDERTCRCPQCYDATCQGDCDACDDADCEQCHGDHDENYDCGACHDMRRCCNYCDKCDEHHGDAPRDAYDYARCDDCDHCRECDHYCD